MKKTILLICAAFLIILIPYTEQNKQRRYTIGFSQCIESDLWRKDMLDGMQKELAFHPNLKLLYKEADGSSQKQIKQVREFINQKIDLLIISPNEAEPLTRIVEEAFNKGIPVIVVDRKITSSLYTAFVGADNYEIGKMAGQYAAQLLKNNGRIIEISGLPKSSPAMERHNGFVDAIKKYPSLKINCTLNGGWLKENAQTELIKNISKLNKTDLIYAHNDIMALGAYEVLKKNKAEKTTKIIGVDGLPGPGGGIQKISDKIITGTFFYPTGSEEAIQIAAKILNKEEFNKDNYLQTSLIDSANVRLLNLQLSKVHYLEKEIGRQQTLLARQHRIYNTQNNYILLSALVIVLLLGCVSFYFLRVSRKINQQLKLENIAILNQKNKLLELSANTQIANESKINFFTNVSHEFRTPLTLILGPLEELLSIKNHLIQKKLSLIHRNAIRLLRIVNQLIDFRKIEVDKMKLRVSEHDLIEFANGIMESYKSIADKGNIDFRLITKERELRLWFDVTMIEKVFYNLLTNAFKFTKENGFIHICITRNDTENLAILTVEDNGNGMTKDTIEHAFDIFYQGDFENNNGSGLGLALSKEFILLHKGQISASSQKRNGTIFKIQLPLGKDHFNCEEIIDNKLLPDILYGYEKTYTQDLEIESHNRKESKQTQSPVEFSILLIEDDTDLRDYLVELLSINYEILQANNGHSALQQCFDNIPDLIICDVIIPGRDGHLLTNIFKSDIRTSHIPIILLTAKTNIEDQIKGMKNNVDAYITKPFNIQFLEENIKCLIANRNRLKEHFTSDISSHLKTGKANKADRKFVNEFTSYIEDNIANEDLSVENVSKNLGISKIQLYRKVKALMGINVSDYILNARLTKAKYMLQHENFTISEIVYKVGFSSSSYFSTVFKSKFGVTPKSFKEK